MTYVFGPVPSRRLGSSLGVDTIPLKTCNWNCVYCQLGRTMPVTHSRREYLPQRIIRDEVAQALQRHAPGTIDWVTIVGSGEPLLHDGCGWLIREIKQLTDLPVAVITNGSLLYLPQVRRDLLPVDAVLPTLDAGTADLYRRINRPHPGATFERLVAGLIAFREQYQGQLWVEVMLMRGLNDSTEALRDIAAILQRVRPDQIHINLPTRPPAETWVEPADAEGIMRAQAILGEVAMVLHPAQVHLDLRGCADPAEAVLDIITRHPMPEADLLAALAAGGWENGRDILAGLAADGRAQAVDRLDTRFWSAAPAHFPSERQSTAVDPRRRQVDSHT